MAFSALIVPVREADWLVRGRVADGHSAAAGVRVPAHVSLLVPFAPRDELTEGVLAELGGLFADVVPFSFGLDEVCRFPDGAVYLAPDPPGPFRQLTHELSRAFPEYPPYGGQFDDVVPHVTVPMRDGETMEDIDRLVAPRRPLTGSAREAVLVWVAGPGVDEELSVVETFPFGTVAA